MYDHHSLPLVELHALRANGTDVEEQGASAASVIPPPQSDAIEKHAPDTTSARDTSVTVAFVSGNPLPLQNFSNVNTAKCDCHGDRRDGQTAPAKHASTPQIYALSSPPQAEVAPAGDHRDRRCLPPGEGRNPPPRPGAAGRRAGDAGPLPSSLTDAPRIDPALAAEGERLVARIIARRSRT